MMNISLTNQIDWAESKNIPSYGLFALNFIANSLNFRFKYAHGEKLSLLIVLIDLYDQVLHNIRFKYVNYRSSCEWLCITPSVKNG